MLWLHGSAGYDGRGGEVEAECQLSSSAGVVLPTTETAPIKLVRTHGPLSEQANIVTSLVVVACSVCCASYRAITQPKERANQHLAAKTARFSLLAGRVEHERDLCAFQ